MDIVREIIKKVEKLKAEKNFSKAVQILQNTLVEHGSDYRIYEEIADIYLYEWKIQKASKAVDFALKTNPESATGNYLKGFILLSKNKVKESISYLENSNQLMPNNAEVLRNLGWAYTMVWNHQKWICILKRALNLSPNDTLITEDLAMALIWLWNVSEWNDLLAKIWKNITI